tara:strand:+ start:225 stop:407 length:183 start_codon:yes stop_codon:yes gene_type:complete
MKLTLKQVQEAAEMEERGVTLWALGQIFGVHETTMSKYLRNYYRYGESYWGRYPTEKHGG